MSLVRKAGISAVWMGGGSYVAFGINFIGQLTLVRLLRPEAFGVYALVIAIVEICFIASAVISPKACIHLQEDEAALNTGLSLAWLLNVSIFLILTGISAGVILFAGHASGYYAIALCFGKMLQGPAGIYRAS